jgi:Tfp pilus assembly protein PilF
LVQIALKHDKQCYNAYVFAGAAAEGLENAANAEQAYRKAVEIDPENPLAFQVSHGSRHTALRPT